MMIHVELRPGCAFFSFGGDIFRDIQIGVKSGVQQMPNMLLLSFFLFSFFLLWGGPRSIRMPALRPASEAGPMQNPMEGTSVVLRNTIRLT